MCGGPQWKREVVPDHKVRVLDISAKEVSDKLHVIHSLISSTREISQIMVAGCALGTYNGPRQTGTLTNHCDPVGIYGSMC